MDSRVVSDIALISDVNLGGFRIFEFCAMKLGPNAVVQLPNQRSHDARCEITVRHYFVPTFCY